MQIQFSNEFLDNAQIAFDLFVKTYEDKYPGAARCLLKDQDELLTFYDFPAAHWTSIRTSNPIESTFATIRHRTKRSKGCLSLIRMLHMMFKLGQCAQKRWHRIRGFNHLAKVIPYVATLACYRHLHITQVTNYSITSTLLKRITI